LVATALKCLNLELSKVLIFSVFRIVFVVEYTVVLKVIIVRKFVIYGSSCSRHIKQPLLDEYSMIKHMSNDKIVVS
jgi:hypothetical protein